MTPARHDQVVNPDGAPAPEAAESASGAAPAPGHDALAGALREEALASEEQDEQESETDAVQADAPEVEDEQRAEPDLEELAAKAGKADEYLELARRTQADFENYRKRTAREFSAAQERGMTKLARELLPAIDNLERALAASEGEAPQNGEGHTLAAGIKLVQAELVAALGRVGIQPFSPVGEQFDPQRHEAIAQHPIEGADPGTVVEVYQRGYTLGDSVLRPARVVVAG